MREKAIPIGFEDIKEMIDKDLYYVDKTLMIKDLLDSRGKVTLFTRPRRFGKTLNLSMIRRFFEQEFDFQDRPVDNGYIFEGLAISECGEKYTSHQQQYPVINLSLKSAKQPNFDMAYKSLADEIANEFSRHRYVLNEASMQPADRKRFESILWRDAEPIEFAKALGFLSQCLAKCHQKNVIILIDEYDVPLENACFEGFYQEMIGFIRSLFESALKTNTYLEFAVITGCLRISRESIFTGLNNLEINSILAQSYSDSFGFTEEEVMEMLEYYDLADKAEELRDWYDGYRFGDREIYNPWSIINYTKTAVQKHDAFPLAYWSNTSSNSIIKELIEEADQGVRKDIESLIAGECIEKPVHEDITYEDIHESADNLWNFLFFTGYLKNCGQRMDEDTIYLELAVPNREIRSVYKRNVLAWFDKRIGKMDRSPLIKAFEEGDCETAGAFISDQLLDTISFFDYVESYYHGFLTGLLKGSNKYEVVSNRESGLGRQDIILRNFSVRGAAMILELKVAKDFDQMEAQCSAALRQIKEKNYEEALRREGYRDIRYFGICFYKKECLVETCE